MTRYTDMHDRAGWSRRLHYGLSLTTLALGAALGLGDASPQPTVPLHCARQDNGGAITMMKKYFLAAAALAALMTSATAQTSTRSFYDNRGSFARGIVWNGQSWTRGNTTSFSDGRGRFSGSAIRHGNSTSFYDGRGRYIGSSINTSARR